MREILLFDKGKLITSFEYEPTLKDDDLIDLIGVMYDGKHYHALYLRGMDYAIVISDELYADFISRPTLNRLINGREEYENES